MPSTDSVTVPLSAIVTTANVSDKPIYPDLISCLSSEILRKIHHVVADPGYDDRELYDLSLKKGFQLVCPIRRYKNTSMERIQLVDFYQSQH
ncbi:MAG: transposase [Candidatus Nitrosocosmicus sp.]|nr:transposase [Candidatus Nitrosocosmicus sp.]MDN5866854.1 transposase [Candidatus Nitrosocosmicus sp.]